MDRLSRSPLRRIERGDRIVKGRDGTNVRPQSSVADPPDDLVQLRTIGLDGEINYRLARTIERR